MADTDDKIAKAVERLGKGTPGPWLAGCGYAGNGDRVYGPDNAGEHSGLLAVTYKGWVNAQKIAALPELAAVFVAAAAYRRAEFEYEQCFEHRIPKGSAFEQMMQARKALDAALNRAAEKVLA